MSDKEFRRFVEEVRAACDRYLAGDLIARVRVEPPKTRVAVKGNPICRCGHNYGVHDEPRDIASGQPANICRGCEADGSKIGCPEFIKKGTLPSDGAIVTTREPGAPPKQLVDRADSMFSTIERAILAALKAAGAPRTAQQVSILAVYTQSGDFNAAVANLRALGAVTRGSPMALTEYGKQVAVDIGARYDARSLRLAWGAKLKKVMTGRMIDRLHLTGPMTASQLAEKCGYTQSGDFNAALAKLRRMGLIVRGKTVRLCPELSS